VSGDAAAGEPQREPGSGSDLLEPTNEVAATRKAKTGDSGNITVFKCPLCDVVSENNIDVHMKKMHPACQLSPIKTTAVASFRCHKCPARFFLKAAGLTRHLVLQHGEKAKALPKRVKKAAPPKGGDHDDDADDRPPSKRRRKCQLDCTRAGCAHIGSAIAARPRERALDRAAPAANAPGRRRVRRLGPAHAVAVLGGAQRRATAASLCSDRHFQLARL
jgi:hypothetical protein